jgi:hypothetical protein
MICGITLSALRSRHIFDYIKTMTEKPDIWIFYIDSKPKSDLELKNRYMRITHNYNKAKCLVPEHGDYVFVLEDDCTPPVDIVSRMYNTMVANNIDCLVTACYQRMLGINDHLNDDLMVYDIEIRKPHPALHHSKNREGLQKVDASSFNCIMFKKKVLDNTNFMSDSYYLTHDMNFFLQCKVKKYDVRCDFSIPMKHANSKDWTGL